MHVKDAIRTGQNVTL